MNAIKLRPQLSTIFTVVLAMSGCGGNGGSSEPSSPTPSAPTPTPPSAGRQAILLEIDRMMGTTPVQVTQTLGGNTVSLAGIYSPANVDLRVVTDQDNIARQERVRLADLHALMTANSSVAANAGEWKVHMLVVTADDEDPDTLGIMFDFGANDPNDMPREGFAVFETAHQGLSGGVVPEVLLTSAHEFAHTLNLHHTDWQGTSFGNDSTVEGYSMTDSVRWSLSPASIAHLKLTDCPRELVAPGTGSLPFALITQAHANAHKSSPAESYDIVPNDISALRRGPSVAKSAAVKGSLARNAGRAAADSFPLRLTIEAPKDTYLVGEAVTLTVSVKNTGNAPQPVNRLLQPEYRFLSIGIKGPNDAEFRPFQPPVLRDARKRVAAQLAPDEAIVAEAKIFFGANGWTLDTPGQYEILATYPAGTEFTGELIQSAPIRIAVKAPDSEITTRARQLLLDEDGQRLGTQQGLYLYMGGGGERLAFGADRLRQIVAEAPQAAQAASARVALATEALDPTFDPVARAEPQPRLDEAQQLLREAQRSQAISGATLARVQGELIEQLEKAGRTSEASAARAELNRELARRKDVRTLNRRDLERSLQ